MVAAAILAGGKGRRLGGRDKSQEYLGSRRLLDLVVDRLRPVTSKIFLIVNPGKKVSLPKGVELVEDIYPETGSLGGLYTALSVSPTFHTLVVACDMPFLNEDLLRYLISLAPGYDVVMPRFNEYLEPLHAVYSRRCLPYLEELIKQNDLKIMDFFPRVRVRYVERNEIEQFDPDLLSFFNINTPEELERARRIIEKDKMVKNEKCSNP